MTVSCLSGSRPRTDAGKAEVRGCTVEGCDRKVLWSRLCSGHYQRRLKYGDVFTKVPLGVVRGAPGGLVANADTEIDATAVDEAATGRPVHLTLWERREAIRRLTANRVSARRIAEIVGVTSRSVVRERARQRQAG